MSGMLTLGSGQSSSCSSPNTITEAAGEKKLSLTYVATCGIDRDFQLKKSNIRKVLVLGFTQGQIHFLGAIIDAKYCVKLSILVPGMGSVQSGPEALFPRDRRIYHKRNHQ